MVTMASTMGVTLMVQIIITMGMRHDPGGPCRRASRALRDSHRSQSLNALLRTFAMTTAAIVAILLCVIATTARVRPPPITTLRDLLTTCTTALPSNPPRQPRAAI